MMEANTILGLPALVRAHASSLPTTAGTIYVRVLLVQPGNADDGKLWDTGAGGSWLASPTSWPTATHKSGGLWTYALPAAATTGREGAALAWAMTDNAATPASETAGSDVQMEELFSPTLIDDAVWDAIITGATHNTPTSAGRRLRELTGSVIYSGTAQGPGTGSNQMQLDTGASATDGAYDPADVTIIAGTGAGQSRGVLQYDGATRTATVDRNWKTAPDATSEYVLYAWTGREHVNEGLAQGGSSTTITLNALASASDDAYNGQIVFIRSGTGEDQAQRVYDYDGTTKVVTVPRAWSVTPDATSGYVMLPTSVLDDSCRAAIATQVDTTLTASHGSGAWTTAGLTGAYSVTLQARTSGGSSIPNAYLSIRDATNTATLTAVTADGSGNVVVALDAATYQVHAYAPGYTFTSPQAIVVSADGAKTITGTAVSAGSPSAPNLCIITGAVLGPDGSGISGAIVRVSTVTDDDGQHIGTNTLGNPASRFSVSTATDGTFSMELIRTALVRVEVPFAGIDENRTVPDAASQDFATW